MFIMHGRFHDNTKYFTLQNSKMCLEYFTQFTLKSSCTDLENILFRDSCITETVLSGRSRMKRTGVRTAMLNKGNEFTHQKNPILPTLSSTEADFYFVRVV